MEICGLHLGTTSPTADTVLFFHRGRESSQGGREARKEYCNKRKIYYELEEEDSLITFSSVLR